MGEKIQLVIIGAGPAGYTASIYAARAGIPTVLYQGAQPGGQLTITSDVENYPGFPEGIQGPDMMLAFQKQAERFGTQVRHGEVSAVDFSRYPHRLTIDDTQTLHAEAVVISTGASAQWLGLAAEERLGGKGVSACAVCDGFFFKGQEVAVVGGGDSACEEALYLSKLCTKVYMLVRRDKLRASQIMQKRVQQTKNIDIRWNMRVEDILGDDSVEGVRLVETHTGNKQTLPLQGFFVAIGHTPNTQIFKGQLNMDERDYIRTQPGTSKTSVEGVFATGDVQDSVYRQAVTAAGSGCMGALDAERFLAERSAR